MSQVTATRTLMAIAQDMHALKKKITMAEDALFTVEQKIAVLEDEKKDKTEDLDALENDMTMLKIEYEEVLNE